MRKISSKSIQAARQREPYTPKPKQQRVIRRHLNGQSNREIADADGIHRDAVGRIVTQPEVVNLVAQSRLRILGLVPKAVGVFEQVLDSDDERTRVAAATKILECTQALPKAGLEIPKPEDDRAQRMRLIYGQIMEMMLLKHQRYGTALPPECEGVEEEARRKLEEPSPGTTPPPLASGAVDSTTEPSTSVPRKTRRRRRKR